MLAVVLRRRHGWFISMFDNFKVITQYVRYFAIQHLTLRNTNMFLYKTFFLYLIIKEAFKCSQKQAEELNRRVVFSPFSLHCRPYSWGWWRVRTAALPLALLGWRSTQRWPVCRQEPQCRAGERWSSGCRTGNPDRDQQNQVRKSCSDTLCQLELRSQTGFLWEGSVPCVFVPVGNGKRRPETPQRSSRIPCWWSRAGTWRYCLQGSLERNVESSHKADV